MLEWFVHFDEAPIPDPLPDNLPESSNMMPWIYLAVGAAVVILAVVVFLILKRKK
ncbi:MAG: hypothetical protein LBR25_09755 [Erysipelotrichaceae bacterium]|jgi:hypothetical protein|nr:hypothetical protein [Erysipelotrichaceae bacterium]